MKITEAAADKTRDVLVLQKAHALRIAVKGGGCSGFQYAFETVANAHNIAEDDIVIEQNGVTFVIDPISSQYLEGAELDFTDNGLQSNFILRNPNATTRCGCGQSFSV